MLTRCPHCLTWFRVRAEHLRVAGGQVTCGNCDAIFDALASLIEETAKPPVLSAVQPAAAASVAVRARSPASFGDDSLPHVDRQPVQDAEVEAVAVSAAADTLELDLDLAPTPTPDEPAPQVEMADVPALASAPPPGPEGEPDAKPDITAAHVTSPLDFASAGAAPQHSLSADDHAILFTAPGSQDDEERDDTVPEVRNDAAPAVLAAELAALSARRPRAARGAGAWAIAAALLFAATGVQLAWIARAHVVQKVPASAPLFDWACARLACPADAAAHAPVRLVARDVREHPQYRDALLVNATLINDARNAQPFPVIELRLHDATGNVLGARAFTPREYLDQSIPLDAGMPAGRPVYVVMELGRASDGAVSFEFTFL